MKLFIIPGSGENTEMKPYKELAKQAGILGYKVIPINPDWDTPITEQTFEVSKKDIVFGFSRGAVLAYATTRKCPAKLAILASMTPVHKFSKKALVDFYGKAIAEDILKINFRENKTPQIRLAGEKENIEADIQIPNTGHRLTNTYIKRINELLASQLSS